MSERIEVAEIKADIKAAFNGWLNAWFDSLGPEGASPEDLLCESKIESSKADAMAFLAQVEAEREQIKELLALAKAYEAWEAEVIMSDDAWEGGMREFPKMTEELWGRLLEIQAMRNEAVAKATN